MTSIVKYNTKKEFKEAVYDSPHKIYVYDPAVVGPISGNLLQVLKIYRDSGSDEPLTVTNHPKRSWYANIRMRKDGSIHVD